MRGKAVPQRVRRRRLVGPGLLRGLMAGAGKLTRGDRLQRITAREQPGPRAAHQPPIAQQLEQPRRQHRVAVLAALALLDPDHHPRAVDIAHLERNDFGHPQTRPIGDAQRRLVLEARCRLQHAGDLLRAQHNRRFARLARNRQMPDDIGAIERYIKEEPQRRSGAVDRSRAYSARCQMQQVAADIFPARAIGRAAKKNGKVLDAPNVIGLRLRHEIAHRHVFNHAPAQRADALIGHGILLSEPRLLTPRSSDRTTRAVIAPTSVPAATLRSALYRARGFVRWGEAEVGRAAEFAAFVEGTWAPASTIPLSTSLAA